MSLHRPHNRTPRLVGGTAVRTSPDHAVIPAVTGYAVQSKETGHIFGGTFATRKAAEDWIDERFYGVTPTKPVMRAMAVRCRVGVSPYVFGQVYTAVSYDPRGFFDKLSIYVPNMYGTFRALPADASIFDPVADEHKPRFKHHAVAGFQPLSAALARIVDKFGADAIMTGRQMAGAA